MTVDRHSGFALDPTALAEDVDLDAGLREEILRAEAGLGGSHWEVLGVPWNAAPEVVRAAHLEKVKAFHPDRHAGRRLGTFRGRLERIFRRLTEARDVLVDPARRAEYVRASAPPEFRARLEARRLEDERRAGERRARLARQNPLVARAARRAELVARGKEALAQGRFAAAANDLLLAQGLDPRDGELAALAAEARRGAARARARDAYEKGEVARAVGSHAAALAAYREALEADPRHARAAAAGARAALALGDGDAARALAEQAVRAGPALACAHEALGLVLEAAGERREARRELERAVELDPKLEVARARLRRLRWSFLG
ncbi:J domain-containing protein [Anaeromyxobacter oryzisoli]|uniref:J domain-containing protein n=1 Tax=Anaeromyxobacter oryzisoli TaxID=2925408 RepID=UPI001F55C234|nr:DnaJ domain-containing protein [Anaeromyxobacter sp. SG63]